MLELRASRSYVLSTFSQRSRNLLCYNRKSIGLCRLISRLWRCGSLGRLLQIRGPDERGSYRIVNLALNKKTMVLAKPGRSHDQDEPACQDRRPHFRKLSA